MTIDKQLHFDYNIFRNKKNPMKYFRKQKNTIYQNSEKFQIKYAPKVLAKTYEVWYKIYRKSKEERE